MTRESPSPPMQAISLLHDDALVVYADERLLPMVSAWLPLHARPAANPESRSWEAAIVVVWESAGDTPSREPPDGEPAMMRFAGVGAYERGGEIIALRAAAEGRIALGTRRARIVLPTAGEGGNDPRVAGDLYSMLTLSAAFLAGRLGGALVHAGAVVDPAGRAWLLAGDTHAGKTTTTVSLVDAGWSFLADDQVVLRRDAEQGIMAEGWPRHAHLDEGWFDSVVTGTRAAVDLRARWGDRWVRRAPLGGLLFPNVAAEAPTSLAPAHAATAFAGLLRQSPWLMADGGAAPTVVELLREACARPAFALSLGRDSYARGDVLAERLAPALSAAGAARR